MKNTLLKILDNNPELKNIFLSSENLETKRVQIRRFLADMLVATFDDNPSIHSLEWILSRDAIRVFRNILSTRSERLAEFSFLQYLDDIISVKNEGTLTKASHGFFSELEHLIRGVVGKSGVYSDKTPEYIKYEGEKAARLRSIDLSVMANEVQSNFSKFYCGLDNDAVRRRSRNKSRILKYFGVTDLEWNSWEWHTKNTIKHEKTLKDLVQLDGEEYKAVKLARENGIPFGITPYYLSLMDNKTNGQRDAAIRSQVIPTSHYVNKLKEQMDDSNCSLDFMLEKNTSPIEGITRRYPMIVILKPVITCPQICVYCQRNWQIEDVHSSHSVLSKSKLEQAINWISGTPEIKEILITGGDPLLMSNAKLENLLFRLSRIKHIERIRIGTRMPVTLPQRVTESLVKDISHFHNPGKREIIIITHFEHSYEITPQAMEAIQKFRRSGMEVYNQLVYTFYNSRKFEASFLRHRLRLIGVTPYYTFNAKGKEETDDFRVPIARLLQEQKEEARLMPGTVRTDEAVFNVPGLGKNYLDATQHHDIISILPDGRRVYEFHPWEKQISLVDTYIYTDVSIHEYLQKLETTGEDINDYKTIWYYY